MIPEILLCFTYPRRIVAVAEERDEGSALRHAANQRVHVGLELVERLFALLRHLHLDGVHLVLQVAQLPIVRRALATVQDEEDDREEHTDYRNHDCQVEEVGGLAVYVSRNVANLLPESSPLYKAKLLFHQ